MNCRGVRRHLAAYDADALSARRRASVGAHLPRCSACRAELAALRSVGALLDSASGAGARPELWAGIEARLAANTRLPLPRTRLSLAWVGGAAAAMAVLAVVLVWPRTMPAAPASEFLGQHQRLANRGPLANGALGDLLTATATTQEVGP
ncbi:MAG: zf-HC2 domain-containing protein [Armatimonadetes bacterium]|nr:zf-HC2 domain-containing protein [Armatimonadota bacterium]